MDLEKRELKVDVLVRHDATRGVYVGQCLQFDVAVQAPSMDKLKQRFAHAFATYVVTSVREERAPRRAPRAFWDLFLTGTADDRDLPIYVPSDTDVRANFRVTRQSPPVSVVSL